MNKIDLIIEKIETAKTERLERQRHKLIDEALAAAKELQSLKPVGYKLKKPYTDIFTDRLEDYELVYWTPLYALDEVTK